ncbi:hypothetical protein [Streptomyces sp. NPDC005078]|uniref:hypothetical protein n=1 Tax=Streptomyces sp. NPDC005078 TaxID=3154293 RepID=UPI0033A6E8FF
MSQPVPPPNQPQQPYDAQPGGGNPFAAQQPGQPGQPGVPTGNPFAGQQPGQPGQFGGVPFAPAAPARNNVALGLLAAGKVGGRNPVLPVLSAVLALVGVYGGQLLGEAIIISKQAPLTVSEIFFDNFSALNEAWKADSDLLTFLFFAIAAFAAFSSAKKATG